MKAKSTIKKIIDMAMLVLLPILAAELQLGQQSHEWFGIAMVVLFVLHHGMNYRWFAGIGKGKYTPVRAFITGLNLLLLLDFLALAYSGAKMSGFVLGWLPVPGSMRLARSLHLSASQWSLILVSLHTGVHSGLHGKIKRQTADSRTDTKSKKGIVTWVVRGILGAVSAFGVYSFIDLKIADYLFMQTHFMFYDEAKSLGFFFAEVVGVMVLFAVVGHYLTCLLRKWKDFIPQVE